MAMIKMRMTGNADDIRTISNLLQSLDGIEHVEEISDLMPHMDDPDSSSAGLSDLDGPGMHEIEVEVPNPATARHVREAVQALAFDLEVLVEFEQEDE